MSLTVDGFAPPRTGLLRGKGGTRQRGDNGVSPLPRAKLQTDSLSPLPRAEPQPEGIAKLPRAKPQQHSEAEHARLRSNGETLDYRCWGDCGPRRGCRRSCWPGVWWR